MSIPHPVQVLNYYVVSNFASALQEDGGNSWREMANLLLSSVRNAFCQLLPWFASSSEESTSQEDDSGQPDDKEPANQPDESEIAKKQKQVTRAICIASFVAIISTLLASIISYTIFANTPGYPLIKELSYR